MKPMGLTEAEREAWLEEMPVLAALKRRPDSECGDFVRATRFGDLYMRTKESRVYYTLVGSQGKER